MSTYKCFTCGFENELSAKYCGNCGCELSESTIGSNRVGTTLLGRYTIRRVIAVGGMGVVYEAEQSLGDYHRTVAIKTLRPELSQDQVVVSRFNRECGIVAQLTHQNTVSLYDYGTTDDGTLYIAMEFVRGQAFSEVIASGALPLDRTLHIVEQMCHSLEEAHGLGIIHRDLKPDNVVLTHHGSNADFVKLLDFGIAVRLSVGTSHETKLTQQGMILGTPPYMSPEQFTGALVTRQSDIYSLAIMTYEALVGQLPFEADSPWTWAQRHMTSSPPDLPSSFPPAVVNTIRAALSKDPASRPRSTVEFYNRLAGGPPFELAHIDFAPVGNAPVAGERATTEPDALPLTSNVSTTSRFDVPLEKTDPAAAPVVVAHGSVVAVAPVAGQERGSVAAYGTYPGPAPFHEKTDRRRGRGPLIGLVVGAGVLLFAVGLAAAYSMDLLDNPFADSGPPSSEPTLASTTADSPAELAPAAQPSLPPYSASEGSSTRPHAHPTVPTPAHSAGRSEPAPSSTVPTAPSTATSSSPGPMGLPPFVMPSNMPSLPSSLPTLPTSIGGIPIPQFLPQPSPSPAPSASSQNSENTKP